MDKNIIHIVLEISVIVAITLYLNNKIKTQSNEIIELKKQIEILKNYVSAHHALLEPSLRTETYERNIDKHQKNQKKQIIKKNKISEINEDNDNEGNEDFEGNEDNKNIKDNGDINDENENENENDNDVNDENSDKNIDEEINSEVENLKKEIHNKNV